MMFSLALTYSLISCVLLGASPAAATDIFVDQSAANCAAGTGTAVDPVCTVAAGVALALPGDTIRIAPGTYTENLSLDFDLDFVGTAGAELTILDGGDFPANPSPERVLTITGAATVLIDGLTIRNGRSVSEGGGGVSTDGILFLQNSTITGNSTGGYGGGILGADGSDVTIERCAVSENVSSASGNFARGGGVFMNDGDLSVLSSTISNNRARASLLDESCSFPIGQGGGGVAFVSDGSLTIVNSTLSGNRATCDGGALVVLAKYSETPTLGAANIVNSTLSGNVANYGGAVLATRLALRNVTITQNVGADSYGGNQYAYAGRFAGLALYGSAANTTTHNSVIAGNVLRPFASSVEGTPSDSSGPMGSLGHNLVGALVSGFVSLSSDQVGTQASPISSALGPLLDNGGETQTHAVLLGSPALDHGDPLSFEPFDQLGRARPFGSAPDIGAVEHYLVDVSYCSGDGGDQMGCTSCPCGNEANPGMVGGCLNSAGTSVQLSASGDPSVSLPANSTSDLRFTLDGAPAQVLTVLVSGSALAPENMANPCFAFQSGAQAMGFDGLRCAILNFRRHGSRSSDLNGSVGILNSAWGGDGGPPAGLAVAFGGFAAGQLRYFQILYRDDPTAVCMRGLNTSQAIEVAFRP